MFLVKKNCSHFSKNRIKMFKLFNKYKLTEVLIIVSRNKIQSKIYVVNVSIVELFNLNMSLEKINDEQKKLE